MIWTGYYYRARARPNNPAAPAKLMATPAVARGAPPVEVDDEGVVDLDGDAAVSEAEESGEVFVVGALERDVVAVVAAVATGVAVTAWVGSIRFVSRLPPAVGVAVAVAVAPSMPSNMAFPAEVAHALTLAGRLLYQAGKVPAWISLMIESREAELSISSYQEAGTAVSMTDRIETGMSGMAMAETSGPWAIGDATVSVDMARARKSLGCILE